jgi:sugar phosphate isomerase/epimerase
VVNLAVDRTGDFSAGSDSERAEAIKKALAYFEVARIVGAPRFRVNSGGGKAPGEAEVANCIAAYQQLAARGAREKIVVLMENHGGISGKPEWIARVMDSVNSKFCRTCPDFGNFPEEIRYQGLAAAAKYADIAHAKTYEFDAAGNETKIDVPRCVKILADAGFRGAWSIEYEGAGDQVEGVRKTIALLRRCA